LSTDLGRVAEIVRQESGMVLAPSQHAALRAGLARAFPGLNPSAFLDLAADPVRGRGAIDRLLDEVTIKETSFLRDRQQLNAIDWRRLAHAAREAGHAVVRVWSAGCATGEEAYTVAMLACEAFAPADPPVRILGTDVSERALVRARAGHSRHRAARGLESPLRDAYFRSEGAELVVGERLRRLVAFRRHNLVADPAPPLGESPFDLILCRNVLIYFASDTVETVLSSLDRSLRPRGVLVLGAVDALCATGTKLGALANQVHATKPWTAQPSVLRRPLGRKPDESIEVLLERAVQAAGEGRRPEAKAHAREAIAREPVNARAHFLAGLVELEAGNTPAAIDALRRALYLDPGSGLAAFKLARAYEVRGDRTAARRAYEQALRTLERGDAREERTFDQVDIADVAAACHVRIAALA
jgi:chemotaxis protein methyltransferase CheR